MLPDTQALIDNLPVTVGWLRKLLEAKFGHEVQLLEVAPLSGVLGMMSALRRVRLHWNATNNTNNNELPETVIIKMPSSSQAIQNLSSATGSDDMAAYTEKIQRIMHNNEVGAYTWLSSVSPSPIPHPQIYAAHNLATPTPIIVMEELEGNLEVLQHGFDEAQLFEITETLARFHAHCLADGSWKEAEFEPMEFGKMSTFGDMIKQLADGLRKGKPGFWECLDPLFEHTDILENYQLGLMERDSPHQILAHGDLWCPQIIWADDGRTIRGILDWQIAHPGSMMEDISRVLATCTKTELRRRLQPKLFDRYYEVLKEECEKNNVTPGFGRDFLDSEFKRMLPYTLPQTLFACGIWANSNVLKRSDADDDARVSEIFARTRAFFEDANKVLGWGMNSN
ncbi:unnamed protein product, partial [Mesorhabditis spiculigera]